MNSLRNNMEKQKIVLPEYNWQELYPYTNILSSSQVLKYLEDPQAFYTEYVLGVKNEPSTPMLIGSIFSELYRDRAFPCREALAQVKAPKRLAETFEAAIRRLPVVPAEVPVIAHHRKWKFRATLDGYVASEYTIIENKTGQTLWDQERVNFNKQLTFQAWCHWKKYGIIPKRIQLNWVNTSAKSTTLLMSFKTTRSVKGLRQFENLIDLAVDGIEAGNFTTPILL